MACIKSSSSPSYSYNDPVNLCTPRRIPQDYRIYGHPDVVNSDGQNKGAKQGGPKELGQAFPSVETQACTLSQEEEAASDYHLIKMLNFQPTLEDLKELSPNLGRNLQEVLDEPFGDNIENLELDFTISGEDGVDTELKENGAAIFVTKYNRQVCSVFHVSSHLSSIACYKPDDDNVGHMDVVKTEYVDACVNYLFNDSVKKQFEDFMRGFEKGCPIKHWKLFLPAELQVVLLGHTEYNWQQLEKNVKYKDYEESDETIKNFWAVFHDLPEKKKKEFLGNARIAFQLKGWQGSHSRLWIQGKKIRICPTPTPAPAIKYCSCLDTPLETFLRKCSCMPWRTMKHLAFLEAQKQFLDALCGNEIYAFMFRKGG
ncbi:putative E3 ubiquitin-protein ligase HERC4 [Varanus komodoensis]|nr:putative E3 ubiquitin-protein ligase HERC4 [Varanus komodoensis]